jgi:hypothetical protein
MSEENSITRSKIISLYMDFVLTQQKKPLSVYKFAKENDFEEQEFYKHFSSFENIESHIFKDLFTSSVQVLLENEEYENFNPRNKLLSFYFTFFENLTANRSYVLYALEKEKNPLKKNSFAASLKKVFTNYISSLEIETVDLKQEKLDKIQQKGLQESAWIQLLITLEFWKKDTSNSFEKTDIFIEKSVNTSFDIINTAPIHSIIDLGKFLFKEKINQN